jgi:hypothetical protein
MVSAYIALLFHLTVGSHWPLSIHFGIYRDIFPQLTAADSLSILGFGPWSLPSQHSTVPKFPRRLSTISMRNISELLNEQQTWCAFTDHSSKCFQATSWRCDHHLMDPVRHYQRSPPVCCLLLWWAICAHPRRCYSCQFMSEYQPNTFTMLLYASLCSIWLIFCRRNPLFGRWKC